MSLDEEMTKAGSVKGRVILTAKHRQFPGKENTKRKAEAAVQDTTIKAGTSENHFGLNGIQKYA